MPSYHFPVRRVIRIPQEQGEPTEQFLSLLSQSEDDEAAGRITSFATPEEFEAHLLTSSPLQAREDRARIEFTALCCSQLEKLTQKEQVGIARLIVLALDYPGDPDMGNQKLTGLLAGFRNARTLEGVNLIYRELFIGRQRILTFHVLGSDTELYKSS